MTTRLDRQARQAAALTPRNPRLLRYLEGAFARIEGFVTREAVWMLDTVAEFQEARTVAGGFLEIGVHHGRFLLALEHAARPAEAGVALDVFGDQFLNIDKSGGGRRDLFEAHLASFALEPSRVRIEQGDSTDAALRARLAAGGAVFRLISIDGGHTAGHAASDLRLAEAVAAPGAAVILDDFFNAGFPGVTEGLALYLSAGGTLRPVGVVGGKMLLAPLSWAEAMRKALRLRMDEAGCFRTREPTFFGHGYLFGRVA
jgi:hypothetical protein